MPKHKKNAREFNLKVFHDGTAYRITMPKVWVERVKKYKKKSIGSFIFDGIALEIKIVDER